GNMGESSATGVAFTRNPSTGENRLYGEFLINAQGEDVVAGIRTPQALTRAAREEMDETAPSLEEAMPEVFEEFKAVVEKLERHYRDVQDIEFTVEQGKLWLLQTRVAKRSAQAAVRLALALRDEGLIDDFEVLRRIDPGQIETLLQPSLQPETRLAAPLLAKGLPACPGVASGRAYADVDEAIDAAEDGQDVILVRSSTSPDDIHGMMAACGIVTDVGGATSHAAVVSRELHRPSVVGCGTGIAAALAGKHITVDGTNGEVREGILKLTAWSEDDTPDLTELGRIARRRSPLCAHATGDHPALDDNTDASVRAALDAGLTDVVSPHPLITMLIAARLQDNVNRG
ncbi:pyruvate, phosphate dikinase, partial [Mycobacterium sp.]|uniref:pyruvate, phosphate dikinase n=1 Tax=Mycobacterium sp. TaxID=1785 RepID=UPI003C77887A